MHRERHGRPMVTVAAIMLVTLLAALDQTIVSTALPRIVDDLDGFEHLSWVVTSYLVASTVTIPLYGRLSDLYGRKRLFVIAIVIFVVGSLLCGLATSMNQLIAFRAVQGLGAGGLIPIAQAAVGDLFAPSERGRIHGYVTSMWAIAAIAGPLVGGGLTDAVSWRWIFLINLPLGAIALLAVVRTMRDTGVHTGHRIDYAGSAVLAVAITALLLACSWAGTTYAWGSVEVLGCAVTGVLGIALFLAIERRAAEPILPLDLFANRIVAVAFSSCLAMGALLFAITIYAPIYLQDVRGDSATASGLMMLGFGIGWVVSASGGGHLMSRTGRYRVFAIWGWVLVVVGTGLLVGVDDTTPLWLVFTVLTLPGIGLGVVTQAYTVLTQNAVADARLGVATAALTFSRSVGAALVVAGLGALLANRVDAGVTLLGGLQSVFAVTAALALAGLVLAFAIRDA